jgi:hypothetical protein
MLPPLENRNGDRDSAGIVFGITRIIGIML